MKRTEALNYAIRVIIEQQQKIAGSDGNQQSEELMRTIWEQNDAILTLKRIQTNHQSLPKYGAVEDGDGKLHRQLYRSSELDLFASLLPADATSDVPTEEQITIATTDRAATEARSPITRMG